MYLSLRLLPNFVVDRPFYYAIVKVEGNQESDDFHTYPLFSGKVVEPKEWRLEIAIAYALKKKM